MRKQYPSVTWRSLHTPKSQHTNQQKTDSKLAVRLWRVGLALRIAAARATAAAQSASAAGLRHAWLGQGGLVGLGGLLIAEAIEPGWLGQDGLVGLGGLSIVETHVPAPHHRPSRAGIHRPGRIGACLVSASTGGL